MLQYEQQTNDLIESFRRQLNSLQPQHTLSLGEEHVTRVNGRNGANALNLAPNSDKLVLDQNADIVWLVMTDGAGYKTVEGFDISKHKETKPEDIYKSFDERLTKLEEAMKNGKPNFRNDSQKPKPGNSNYDAGNRSNDKG